MDQIRPHGTYKMYSTGGSIHNVDYQKIMQGTGISRGSRLGLRKGGCGASKVGLRPKFRIGGLVPD